MPTPKIIPVIDIMGGQVVRAVGGRRSEYRPVRSVLTDSTEPGEVARALVAATGAESIYVADLDAIVAGKPDIAGIRAVTAAGARVLYDGGFRTLAETALCDDLGLHCVVGTETGSLALVAGVRDSSRRSCAVSLDHRGGLLVGDPAAWGGTPHMLGIATEAICAGAGTLIFIDLERVGTGQGPGTELEVGAFRRSFLLTEILAGGGVRTWAEVQRLTDAGANAVLVASALHDGTLTLPRPAA